MTKLLMLIGVMASCERPTVCQQVDITIIGRCDRARFCSAMVADGRFFDNVYRPVLGNVVICTRNNSPNEKSLWRLEGADHE